MIKRKSKRDKAKARTSALFSLIQAAHRAIIALKCLGMLCRDDRESLCIGADYNVGCEAED